MWLSVVACSRYSYWSVLIIDLYDVATSFHTNRPLKHLPIAVTVLVAATANWVATQIAVAATNHRARSSDETRSREMKSDEMR